MGTENNQQPVRTYTTDYKNILSAVFEKTKAFGGAFSPVQMLDGIQENDTAFSVKTNDTPVVIGTYDTDPNVGFGTGASNSSRFGNLTEIKYQNTSVPYSFNISIHEGLSRFFWFLLRYYSVSCLLARKKSCFAHFTRKE
ncbi:hypothetical protein AGMMS49975_10890 [Clostridia bacterium]|nr:hypothetical protein AGMMS49975_10890 [Clostridia bacterium]